jgi:hypothetical protein
MQLKALYQIRFRYPEDWQVELKGTAGLEEQLFFIAEGRCTGAVAGRFRGANHPRRRTDRTGRAYPPGRRQIVGAAWHLSDHEKYRRLNDTICVLAGEVRVPDKPPEELRQVDVELVMDVSELVWEAPKDSPES